MDIRLETLLARIAVPHVVAAFMVFSAALADAQRSYALAIDIGLPLHKSGSAQRIATIEAELGHYRRAYMFSLESAELAAKANREKASNSVVQLAQRYETESKRRQIEELTRRNEQQTAELKQRKLQQRWLWTVLGGSLVMLAGSAYFLLRLRRSHAIIRNLNTSLEQRVQARTAELRQQARYLRTLIDALPWWYGSRIRKAAIWQSIRQQPAVAALLPTR